jgi:DNA-binding NtrC family response regulator
MAHLLLVSRGVMAKTILVVDDDPAVLQSYDRLLRRLGHRVLLSGDSEKVRTDPESLRDVDLVILDERMPRTSGLTLLASVNRGRASGVGAGSGCARGVPAVILISAFLSDDLRKEAVRLGVLEILEKPVDPARLLSSVRAALEGSARVLPEEPSLPPPPDEGLEGGRRP